MNARRTITALILGLVVGILPSVALAGGRPQTMSSAAYRALVAQGQAMNARYGNAVTQLSSQEFTELWRDGGSKLSPEALNALVTRSQAMNAAAAEQFHGLPPSAYSALEAKSEALNSRYGDAVTRLSPAEFIALYNAGGSKLSPEALNALIVRSQAMNRIAASAATSPVTTSSSSSFAWGDFGIGAAAMVGLILLLGGVAIAVRTARGTGVATRVG